MIGGGDINQAGQELRRTGGKPRSNHCLSLDKLEAIWHSSACALQIGVLMKKSFFAIAGAAISLVVLSSSSAYSGPYPFGDEPYRLDWGYDSAVESGCLRWNWQLQQWNDHCTRYVQPKAYMRPRASHVVVRTKG